ncbi:MAG: nucleotidyltransferase domain-containing protein [Patescibacteria group bacterium]|jgi:predicted nucleotidyltransferase|nr:nucleotidyltransferase domain-containing protein [bacterium]HQC50152.1 nucleotidyltransferase domain-containing protein [bacterium]
MFSFKSKITVKILNYYFLNPKKTHYINELAKILEVDPGNLFRKLKELEKEGILKTEMIGNQRYFSLNEKSPLLGEYKKIFEARHGLPEILKNKLKEIKGLEEAYLFGSFVKGNFSEESDIDLLLVGKHKFALVSNLVNELEKKLGREINVVDFTKPELTSRLEKNDDFLKNVFAGKYIKLI